MNLTEYLNRLVPAWTKPVLDPKSFGVLKYSTPITPVQYLEFAEKDLRLGGARGLVNALTNAKRSIDCEIHTLLGSLGVPEPRTFPERLERLKELGLLAPRIVRKIVQLRNVLEHEYYRPTAVEVEDAVDIAALFIGTVKPYHVGGSYMESTWLADEGTVNSRGEIVRTKTHTTWRHDAEPRYTFSSGIFIESSLASHEIYLDLVHMNQEIASLTIGPKSKGYIGLQALLLRAEVDNIAHTRRGVNLFVKALRAAA